MTQKRKILFLENDETFRAPLTELLQYQQFQVLEAKTVEEAEQILADNWVHMAIVDLSMTEDENDRSGMLIVNNPNYMTVPKVILTGHGNDPALIRETFKEDLVVDFIDKHNKDHERMLIDAFTQNVHINWDLQIQWDSLELKSLISLASFILPNERVYLAHRIDELEDLLRQLFLDSQQITVGRLLAFNAEVAWLEVFTQDVNVQESQFIVACGQKQYVNHQVEQHKKFAPQKTIVGNVRLAKATETLRFAAAAYDCVGGNLAGMMSLNVLYLRRPVQGVTVILDQLFNETLASWHHEKSSVCNIVDLTQLYRAWSNKQVRNLDIEAWRTKLEHLCNDASRVSGLSKIGFSDEQLTLYTSETSGEFYPNPIHFLFEGGAVLNISLIQGAIHGALHLNDILVDIHSGITWLTDFSQIRKGPILLDYVALESSLKTELLAMVDIETWCTIEKRLVATNSLDEAVLMDDLTPEVQKILQMIGTIRQRATMIVNQELKSYLAGLFIHSVNQLATYNEDGIHISRDLAPYLTHLISAAMVCQYLTPPREFVVDFENKVVTVEGKQIEKLPNLGWKLLNYLHDRVGQLCSYKDILREVWQDSEDDINNNAWMLEYGRPKVNARIVDLRRRLEPNSKQPKYITLIHDQGYKLVV